MWIRRRRGRVRFCDEVDGVVRVVGRGAPSRRRCGRRSARRWCLRRVEKVGEGVDEGVDERVRRRVKG